MDRKKNFEMKVAKQIKIQSYFSRIKKCNSQNKFRGFLTFLIVRKSEVSNSLPLSFF